MYYRRLAAALCLLFSFGCRKPEPPIERFAILRFENLTPDPQLDWMGRAASEILIAGLSASPKIYVIPSGALRALSQILGAAPVTAPGVSSERSPALMAGATKIVYGQISNAAGSLRLEASVYNTATQRMERTASATGPESAGILALAESLARHLADTARPFGTRNTAALKEYVAGLEAASPAAAVQDLSRAVAADPNFGAAYLGWFQMEIAQRHPNEAERVLQLAQTRASGMDGLSRLRLELEAARFRGDSAAAAHALEAIVRLTPADLGLFRNLGEGEFNARRYGEAIQHFRKALEIEPADPQLWNLLGYAQAYAGDLDAATKSLREYERLRPAEANPLDSLGDVNFYLGHFEDAEKFYLQAQAKDANFANGSSRLKAAYARLLTGDISGADAIFQKYLDARPSGQNTLLEYRQAEWDFLTGRRRRAMDRLLASAQAMSVKSNGAPLREMVSSAYTQLAIWDIDMGDRQQARANALKARTTAGPGSAVTAIMAGFLTQSAASANEWKALAQTYFPSNAPMPFRQLSLAYSLLFAKQFDAAEPVLKQLYDQSSPTAEQNLPVLLAWSLIETGRWRQAAALVATNPIPRATGFDPFSCLAFPRLFFLRGLVLEKQGRVDDARRNYSLFSKLAGPDPDIFGGR